MLNYSFWKGKCHFHNLLLLDQHVLDYTGISERIRTLLKRNIKHLSLQLCKKIRLTPFKFTPRWSDKAGTHELLLRKERVGYEPTETEACSLLLARQVDRDARALLSVGLLASLPAFRCWDTPGGAISGGPLCKSGLRSPSPSNGQRRANLLSLGITVLLLILNFDYTSMQNVKKEQSLGLKDLKRRKGVKPRQSETAHQYSYGDGVLARQNTQSSHYLNYPLNQGHFLG